MASKIIKASVLGFDSRSTQALNMTLGSKSGHTIEVCDVVSAEGTDVVLIDMDSANASKIWADFRPRWPDIPVIVLSKNRINIENTGYINKPFKLNAMIKAIKQAAKNASPAKTSRVLPEPNPVVTQTAVKQNHNLTGVASKLSAQASNSESLSLRKLDALNPDQIYFNPDAHILGLVIKGAAETSKRATIGKIQCLLNKTILIDATSQRIYSTLTDVEMRQIAIIPLGQGEQGLDTKLEIIKSLSTKERDLMLDPKTRNYQIDKFIWELAVLTSKGRIPEGIPVDKPTYLMQWPNFTRLAHIPHAMRVAAYWVKQTSSLVDLANNLQVPLKDILGFYAAASSIKLAGIGRRQEDNMIIPEKPEQHKHRRFFNSALGSIKDKISDIRENK